MLAAKSALVFCTALGPAPRAKFMSFAHGQAQTSRHCPNCSSEACPHLTEASRLSLRDVSKAFALAGYIATSGKPLSGGNRSNGRRQKHFAGSECRWGGDL
jgi:hypothetical protein